MTPEARKVFKRFAKDLTGAAGISESDIKAASSQIPSRLEDIAYRARNLIMEGNLDEAETLLLEAQLIKQTPQELASQREAFDQAANRFVEELEQLGIAHVDVPWPIEEEQAEEIRRGAQRDRVHYVDSAFPQALSALFMKDDEGNFIHNSYNEIAQAMLQPDFHDDREWIIKARDYFLRERRSLQGRLNFYDKKQKISEIISEKGARGSYLVNYSDLTVEEFESVLWRLAYRAVRERRIKSSDLEPIILKQDKYAIAEHVLCAKLGYNFSVAPNSNRFIEIENKLLEGKSIDELARERGMQGIGKRNLLDILDAKAKSFAQKRQQKLTDTASERRCITDEEENIAIRTIIEVINKLQDNPDTWSVNSIPRGLYGFKTLALVVNEIRGDLSKIDSLIHDILFPAYEIIVDGADGYVTKISRKS